MKYPVLAVIQFCAIILLHYNSFSQAQKIESKYVLVDGHKMHYQLAGHGETTVVLESGLGDSMAPWRFVFDDIARFSRVVRYDRLGLGNSEPTDQPRSFKQIATELHTMLHEAGISPPYVLVGHSMGGGTIRAFSSLFRNEVSGLVFIDPFSEYMLKDLTSDEILSIKNDPDSLIDAPKPVKREFNFLCKELFQNCPELHSIGALPDIPMIMLVAGKDRPPRWERNLIAMYTQEMGKLSEANLIVLRLSPHYIQRYDREITVRSIEKVVFPDAENLLRKNLLSKGVDGCVIQYKKMKLTYPADLLAESVLNTLGYQELNGRNIQGAIKLFKLNAEMYPGSSNAFDSLGEAYMEAGNTKDAIKSYEKSLALNPSNLNASEFLKKVKRK